MGTLTTSLVSPANPKLQLPSLSPHQLSQRRSFKKLKHTSAFPVARLFGPAIFEASKLKVLFLGADEKKHPGHNIPRTYTLTHSDVTSKLTLAVSQSINNSQLQGWYNKLQRDEVVAEWKKVKGVMSLHVHCHISGGHFLLDLFARLRYYIFCKELPVVLKAFVHGDVSLFKEYPELEDALVWVYFHSNIPEFNKVECWGPLKNAAQPLTNPVTYQNNKNKDVTPQQACLEDCTCCFPPMSSIPWPSQDLELENRATTLQ
uniref:Staygreen protein domain-containing protein n=1 Tax=Kalanchoe fedtschenkoi TaxID=63787 RepID=A0A7N0UR52_KALFE